jgi:DtxR family Mn-dependent transcriptional regulator
LTNALKLSDALFMAQASKPTTQSESVDDYLKAILDLSGSDDAQVPSKALAERLHVAPASITNMLQKLAAAANPLVQYEKHRGVRLSPSGRSRALEIVRHHRLIETFLYKILDYPLEEVHAEAERLEHFISERFEERIAAKLGNPEFDPHGHLIPALNGAMPVETHTRLSDVSKKGSFIIASVADRDAALLRQLSAKGIRPGVRIRLKENPTVGSYRVDIADGAKNITLNRASASQILIVSA